MENNSKINTACLLLLSFIALACIFYLAKVILIPFTMALFIALIYSPLIKFFQKKFKLPRWIVLLVSLSVFVGFFLLVSGFIANSIDSFLIDANQYKIKLDTLVIETVDYANNFGISLDKEQIQGHLSNLPIFSFIKSLTGSMVSLVSNTFLVIIFTLFLLTGDSSNRSQITIIQEIKNSSALYVGTKLLTSGATAVLSYIIFKVFSIEMAFMFATLTFLLNFIPNVGSIIAILIPLPLIVLQYGIGLYFALALGLLILVQILIGNILEPKLMGDSMDLHPVTILLFLTLWGFLWGVPGMFLSVPITATLKIIFTKFEITQPIAELFAGRIQAN